jgi:hypothetical protein
MQSARGGPLRRSSPLRQLAAAFSTERASEAAQSGLAVLSAWNRLLPVQRHQQLDPKLPEQW